MMNISDVSVERNGRNMKPWTSFTWNFKAYPEVAIFDFWMTETGKIRRHKWERGRGGTLM